MIKIFTQQFIGVLGILCSIILSLTLAFYASDQKEAAKDRAAETRQRISADSLISIAFKEADIEIIEDVEKTYSTHEKFHDEQTKTRIERDKAFLMYIKQRFDGMEKLQREINK